MYVDISKDAGMSTDWFRDTAVPEENQVYPEPAAHPTKLKPAKWKTVIEAKGPVGLLTQAALRTGSQLDANFRLWQRKEEPIDILQVPYQHLSTLLLQATMRARTKAARSTKSINQNVGENDLPATCAINSKTNNEQKTLLNVLRTEGGYAKAELAQLDAEASMACDDCDHPVCDMEHILFGCTFFRTAMMEADPEMAKCQGPSKMP